MKMNIAISMLAALLAISANAAPKRGTASNGPDTGLNCQSEYRAKDSLSWNVGSGDSGHWILGQKSSVTLKDTYGNAPKVTIEAVSSAKDQFRVRVTQGGRELLNAVSAWTGIEVTVPVDFTADGSEDPPHFDYLKVICEKAILAG